MKITQSTYRNTATGFLVAVVGLALLATPVGSKGQALAKSDTQATLHAPLSIGMQSYEVLQLQQFLALDSSVYPEGLVTGYFGPLTQAAVARYQAKNHLPATGYVGVLTIASLNYARGQVGIGGPLAGDVWAPVIFPSPNFVLGATKVTIRWKTDEDASSKVYYGRSWPFLLASAPVGYDYSIGTDQEVTLTGLLPDTDYYVMLESGDLSGNLSLAGKYKVHTLLSQ